MLQPEVSEPVSDADEEVAAAQRVEAQGRQVAVGVRRQGVVPFEDVAAPQVVAGAQQQPLAPDDVQITMSRNEVTMVRYVYDDKGSGGGYFAP